MKIFFIIALCLLNIVVAVPKDMLDVDKYNMLRHGFAHKNQIPNMWHLTENPSLDMYGSYFEANCTRKLPFALLPFRYMWTDGGYAQQDFDNYWLSWFMTFEKRDPKRVTAMHKTWEKTTAWFLEYIIPLHTQIWCIPKTCTMTPQPQEKDYYHPKYPSSITFNKLCILASEMKFSFYLPMDPKLGKTPGSECGPNGKNLDGLCVPKDFIVR